MPSRQLLRNNFTLATLLLLTLFASGLGGCDRSIPTEPVSEQTAPATIAAQEPTAQNTEPTPPVPPINETFETEPQLSLFPRAGALRPEETEESAPYWKTFIEHIVKTSGPTPVERKSSKVSWGIRSINSIDSVGFFSPLAVQPDTLYRITFLIKTDLAKGASAGVGLLEFSEFLWIGNQFSEAEMKEYATGSQEGVRLAGSREWEEQTFTFTTGPDTRMIHLIFFREGEHDRNPVLFDDISIAAE
jgi:hypothetical protein